MFVQSDLITLCQAYTCLSHLVFTCGLTKVASPETKEQYTNLNRLGAGESFSQVQTEASSFTAFHGQFHTSRASNW